MKAIKIDRQDNCWVFKQTYGCPIEIYMHHFYTGVLIVNEDTGDICYQSFARNNSGLNDFEGSSLSRLKHECFFSCEGKKSYIILETSYDNCRENILPYRKYIEDNGASYLTTITSKVHELPYFGRYKYGEIGSHFTLTLGDTTLTSFFKDIETSEPICVEKHYINLPAIGTVKSTIPDIKSKEKEYFKYRSTWHNIVWNNLEDLKSSIETESLMLSNYPSDGILGNALDASLRFDKRYSKFAIENVEKCLSCFETIKYAWKNGMPLNKVLELLNILTESIYEEHMLRPTTRFSSKGEDTVDIDYNNVVENIYFFILYLCKDIESEEERKDKILDNIRHSVRFLFYANTQSDKYAWKNIQNMHSDLLYTEEYKKYTETL